MSQPRGSLVQGSFPPKVLIIINISIKKSFKQKILFVVFLTIMHLLVAALVGLEVPERQQRPLSLPQSVRRVVPVLPDTPNIIVSPELGL